ncbi:MAG: S8 family peptidase, partial [Actinomycetota bacterium]|nr:S8 family peptidase [Actinomycetota bacterium]
MDHAPAGAPYVAGELIVTYEEQASEGAVESLDEEVGAEVEEKLPEIDARLFEFPEVQGEPSQEARERDLQEIKQQIESDPAVESVGYNYLVRLAYTPNDPRFRKQWGLRKTGFENAWDSTRGSGTKIALVDTGMAVGHEDLKRKVTLARDFVNDDNTVKDLSGHGTHVAGIAAARTANRKGVAGGCPNCDLLVAKVFDGLGTGTVARVAEGIVWSADHGADVINLSVTHPGFSTAEKTAVDYAAGKGAVVVAAAGNDNTDDPTYPAALSSVMAVAATNQDDRRASFSNYGDWVDVAAPGVGVLSTIPGGYASWNGTSMATPHVSALAGLLAAQGLGDEAIRARILDT